MLTLLIGPIVKFAHRQQYKHARSYFQSVGNGQILQWDQLSNINILRSRDKKTVYTRAALTTHELEWLEPWGKLAELELKCSNHELVYVGNTNVTQST